MFLVCRGRSFQPGGYERAIRELPLRCAGGTPISSSLFIKQAINACTYGCTPKTKINTRRMTGIYFIYTMMNYPNILPVLLSGLICIRYCYHTLYSYIRNNQPTAAKFL